MSALQEISTNRLWLTKMKLKDLVDMMIFRCHMISTIQSHKSILPYFWNTAVKPIFDALHQFCLRICIWCIRVWDYTDGQAVSEAAVDVIAFSLIGESESQLLCHPVTDSWRIQPAKWWAHVDIFGCYMTLDPTLLSLPQCLHMASLAGLT